MMSLHRKKIFDVYLQEPTMYKTKSETIPPTSPPQKKEKEKCSPNVSVSLALLILTNQGQISSH